MAWLDQEIKSLDTAFKIYIKLAFNCNGKVLKSKGSVLQGTPLQRLPLTERTIPMNGC